MSCCNHKRTAFKNASHPISTVAEPYYSKESVSLKGIYMGRKSKIIHGSISGQRYHFRFKGQVLAIDERDASSIAAEGDIEIRKV